MPKTIHGRWEYKMNSASTDTYDQFYKSKFPWRESMQINNLKELAEITNADGVDPVKAFPVLFTPGSDDPKDALRWSILMLAHEGSECYILGEFQSCILTCGAVIERTLKLEYEEVHISLPKNRKGKDMVWTLGSCICKLDWTGTRITAEILELAKQLLEPRNNRAHALLEHTDPLLSILGGLNRGIEFLNSGHILIEPYHGDASEVIEITFKILAHLYKKT
jgi:hypothetical protein